jgi:hypothetical protein
MDEKEFAIRRFDTLTRYYSYETTMYWSRSQFFLVANAALLGFAASNLIRATVDHPYLLGLLCAFGAVLSLFWYLTLRAGQYWTERWERVCIALEPMAMGDVEVFRNCRPTWHISTKKMARITAWLFIIVWIAAMLYSVRATFVGLI